MTSPRAQSPIRTQSPSQLTTDELLTRVLSQMETLTNAFNSLKKENDNRIEGISQLARKVGCSAEVDTDKEAPQLEISEDTSDGEQEDGRVNQKENINRSKFCTQPTYEGEDRINVTIALETIRTLNGQDDIGGEDFVKSVKRARMKKSQPNLLLDLIIAKKIQGLAEKEIRYQQINSYDDLYEA